MFVLIREETSLNVNAQDVKSPTSLLIKDAFLRFLALLAPKIGFGHVKTQLFQSNVMKIATECEKESWDKSNLVKKLMFSRTAPCSKTQLSE